MLHETQSTDLELREKGIICIGNKVFEKLTSVCYFKLHEKPYYYLLIIYMKKFRVNYIFICSQSSAIGMCNFKPHVK